MPSHRTQAWRCLTNLSAPNRALGPDTAALPQDALPLPRRGGAMDEDLQRECGISSCIDRWCQSAFVAGSLMLGQRGHLQKRHCVGNPI